MIFKNFYDKETKQPWCVTVSKGSDPQTVVEFYDARYEHTDYGQFVARYYLTTIIDHTEGVGLNLDCSISEWKILGKTMDRIVKWLKEAQL